VIGLPLVIGIILIKPILGFLLLFGIFGFIIWTLIKFASGKRVILFYENNVVLKTGFKRETLDYSLITKIDYKKPYRDIDRMVIWFNDNKIKIVFKIESNGGIDKKSKEIIRFVKSKNEKVIDLCKIKTSP